MNLPPIRYVKTSDGVSIAYLMLGAGPPVVFASNIFGDLALYRVPWEHVRGVTDGLVARSWSVVRYDVRGMGSSDRNVNDLDLDARVRDLEAVVDALGLDRFALGGADFGAATAVAFAASRPERVDKLILLSPWVRGNDRFAVPGARVATSIRASDEPGWPFATKAISSIATNFEGWESDKAGELAAAIRQSTSPEMLSAHRRASIDIDLEEYLPRLTVPTLITHDPYFAFGSFDLCKEVASGIQGAGLVVVDENSIAGNQHDRHVEVIDRFLRAGARMEPVRHFRPASSRRWLLPAGLRLGKPRCWASSPPG